MGENYKLKKIVLSLCSCMYHIIEYICVCVFILDKAIHNRQLSVERPLEEQVSEIKNIYKFFFYGIPINIFSLSVTGSMNIMND